MVLRDSRGRYYSTNAGGWRGVVGVWGPRGEYHTSVGGVGEGPGELSDIGILSIFLDGEDRLHVRDGGFNWSVFSPSHEFLRRVPSQVMEGFQKTTVILDSGMALTSTDGYHERNRYFRLVDSAGVLHRTFGSVDPQMSRSDNRLSRSLAYGGGDTFWAGPAAGDPRGYLVEEWGIDGTLRRSLLRDASWFDPLDDELRVEVGHIHIDESGLLYIVVARGTEELAEAMENARRLGQRISREERSALTELVVEMIDSRTGELLASEVHRLSKARTFIPNRLFRGRKQGAVYLEGGDGLLPFVDIVSVELEAR